ncbi:helix-turn-helix transcriptional regulator [Georgenia halophila]|uniref:Helix-turn-helix transcriptional regulator n=1 Tax=Georgenia halophila TaxID=620889 RepID=A0ABP8L484_9MICO
MNGSELGAFLRTRRETVTPEEVGLPRGPRRRTPGLRREELATLAGMSVDYLTRLERGKDQNPSAQVLAVLADTLRLSAEERFHLLILSKEATGAALLCPTAEPPSDHVRPTVQALLDRLGLTPAYVVNSIGDVVASTTGFEHLAASTGLFDAVRPNLARYVFTDRRAQQTYPDWDAVADEWAATLKAASCPEATMLVDELSIACGAAFTARWEASSNFPRRTGTVRMAHPDVGELRLALEVLEMPDAGDQRLVVHLPADDATCTALDQLAGRRPGALRTVGG